MTVDSNNSMQQMQQMQMRKMDGSGGGQGRGGMKDIMSGLSSEDQIALKEQMSTMSMDERMSMVSQMKEVDKASMSDQEYAQTLLDILDEKNTNKTETDGFSVYA